MRQVTTKSFGDTEVGPLIKPEERLLGEGYLWWVIRSFQSQLNQWNGGEKSFLWEEACVCSQVSHIRSPLQESCFTDKKGIMGWNHLTPSRWPPQTGQATGSWPKGSHSFGHSDPTQAWCKNISWSKHIYSCSIAVGNLGKRREVNCGSWSYMIVMEREAREAIMHMHELEGYKGKETMS